MLNSQDHRNEQRSPTPIEVLHHALNGRWHKQSLQVFMVIVVSHWLEHILQAIQIFVLGWPRPLARGALGLIFPWLVSSESLHYIYALLMLLGLYILRPAFDGPARTWWNIALAIQFWHHFEHALLLGQAMLGRNLFGLPAPTSVIQLFVPRVELHLFYNAVVLIPMVVAMYAHRRAPAALSAGPVCNCVHSPRRETVVG